MILGGLQGLLLLCLLLSIGINRNFVVETGISTGNSREIPGLGKTSQPIFCQSPALQTWYAKKSLNDRQPQGLSEKR
jgi:hypothetical protein